MSLTSGCTFIKEEQGASSSLFLPRLSHLSNVRGYCLTSPSSQDRLSPTCPPPVLRRLPSVYGQASFVNLAAH